MKQEYIILWRKHGFNNKDMGGINGKCNAMKKEHGKVCQIYSYFFNTSSIWLMVHYMVNIDKNHAVCLFRRQVEDVISSGQFWCGLVDG